MAFTMKNTELRFPVIHLFTGDTPPVEVDPATASLAYTSDAPTIVAWEMRKADGSVGDAADPGKQAAVAQGVDGNAKVHVTVTNLDGSTVVLDADFVVGPEAAKVASGTLDFAAAMPKA
jgi:hypothetical protein